MSLNGKVKAGKSLTGKIENIRQIADLTAMFNKVDSAIERCETATESANDAAENANTAAENAEEQTIYEANVSTDGELLLIRKNGRVINAGNVKGEAGKDAEYNLVANAIKGNKSGNPIALSDVSPLPHEIKVKLSGFSVEEVFKYDENLGVAGCFLYTDITESGVYVVESVTYDEYGDSTYITFEGGVTAETNWRDGEPFAVGDAVFVKVDGETYSFSVLHGAVVQKFFGENYALTPTFSVPIGAGGSLYSVAKGNLKEPLKAGHTYTITVDISGGNPSRKVYLFENQSFQRIGSGWFMSDGRQSMTFTVGNKDYTGLYFYSAVDLATSKLYEATFDNITICEGELLETLTADEEGNIGIIGNGESMTLIAEDGVTMEAEYNRDINKAFAELQNAIISLGGNV
jgi:hypothetical protein